MRQHRSSCRVLKSAFSYVRFSSSEQSKGDSLRRQTALAEEYAQKHSLQLDRELTFRDLGISAFTGKNKTEGALAAFIKACKSGRVKPGSALLVESLDRLSREQVRKALRQLLELIDDHGIEVHTLADDRVYGPGTQTEELIFSIIVMSRANEESERKSQRVGSAWRNKKASAANNLGIAITAKVPAWIHAEKGKRFQLIEKRAKAIRKIFSHSLDGLGAQLIAQYLNENHQSFTDTGNGWHKSYVEKILVNPASYGAFQPYHRLPNGKREKDGDLILDYFPAAIDFKTFKAVQEARKNRYRKRKGKSDAKINNLFAGLLTDTDLRLPMTFYWRGNELITDSYRFRKKPNRINYSIFEDAFLHFLDALDWRALQGGTETAELKTANSRLNKLLLDREKNQRMLDRLAMLLLADDEPPKTLLAQLKECEQKEQELIRKNEAFSAEIARLKSQHSLIADPAELRAALRNSNDLVTRVRLREEIRKRLSEIKMYFRFKPLIITDIEFVNGSKRQIVFWPKEQKGYVISAEAKRLLTQPLEKGVIYFY
jgi:DNA invertase Pin-like site-specific DNA recombinase